MSDLSKRTYKYYLINGLKNYGLILLIEMLLILEWILIGSGYASNGNIVQRFKPGSFKCAMKAQVPIIPVTLIDSYLAFNSFKPGPVTTKVIFGEPIYYETYKDMKTHEVADIVRNTIISTMEEFGVYVNNPEKDPEY